MYGRTWSAFSVNKMGHHWTDYCTESELEHNAINSKKLEIAKAAIANILNKLCAEYDIDRGTQLLLTDTFKKVLNEFSGLR